MGTKATVYTQSITKGSSVDDSQADEPIVTLDIDDILNYEPLSKMQIPESRDIMLGILAAIKNGEVLPPILVRKVDGLRGVSKPRYDGQTVISPGGVPNARYKYQVVDGHHRYSAYKIAGVKQVPAIVITPENISREKFWIPE